MATKKEKEVTLEQVLWNCRVALRGFGSFEKNRDAVIGLAFLLQCASTFMPNIDMPKGNITSIEPASDGMMITYFGLFFFALSVNNAQALMITFILLFVCLLFSNVYMFNPLFSITQYKFYYITFKSGKKCLLMSKEKFAYGDNVEFTQLYKLNEFTFID